MCGIRTRGHRMVGTFEMAATLARHSLETCFQQFCKMHPTNLLDLMQVIDWPFRFVSSK